MGKSLRQSDGIVVGNLSTSVSSTKHQIYGESFVGTGSTILTPVPEYKKKVLR